MRTCEACASATFKPKLSSRLRGWPISCGPCCEWPPRWRSASAV